MIHDFADGEGSRTVWDAGKHPLTGQSDGFFFLGGSYECQA